MSDHYEPREIDLPDAADELAAAARALLRRLDNLSTAQGAEAADEAAIAALRAALADYDCAIGALLAD